MVHLIPTAPFIQLHLYIISETKKDYVAIVMTFELLQSTDTVTADHIHVVYVMILLQHVPVDC